MKIAHGTPPINLSEEFANNGTAMLRLMSIYSREYRGQTIVIKIGGEVIDNEDQTLFDRIMEQAVTLKTFGANVIICHGGGKQIDRELKSRHPDLNVVKREGIRVADSETLIVSREVGASLRQKIADRITEIGYEADIQGSPIDTGTIIQASQMFSGSRTGSLKINLNDDESIKDKIALSVKQNHLNDLIQPDIIPVLDWHCRNVSDRESTHLTVNADEVACVIAAAMNAKRLIFFSMDATGQVRGVHQKGNPSNVGDLINELNSQEALSLIENGTIEGGMKVKIEMCIAAVKAGVEGVVICHPEDVIKELLLSRDGAGTLIKNNPTSTPTPA